MKAWLARHRSDEDGRYAFYCLSFGKKPMFGIGRWYEVDDSTTMINLCPRRWVRAGGMKLKPGEGPVRVEIEVVCRAVKR